MKIFHLPDLGEGLAEAEIREWYVKVGDVVSVDQPLVSMETAKAVVDVPSPYAGKIVALHGKANDIIKTEAPLVTFEIEGKSTDQGSVVGKLETQDGAWQEQEMIVGKLTHRKTQPKIAPPARLLAKELGIDLATVNGTGPGGLITVADIKRLSQSAEGVLGDDAETLHGVRRTMVYAMTQSHQAVVPVTLFDDVDISHLSTDADLSVIILKAMISACHSEPALNAWFDGKTMQRKCFKEVNIGLAVDSEEGLFVPVIKQADSLSHHALREQINRFKKEVRERSLQPAEFHGGTITFSNFGTIAGRYATPIIVPPSVAILGCGRRKEVPVVVEGNIQVGNMLPLSLTFDHRAVTGGEATRFLAKLMEGIRSAS